MTCCHTKLETTTSITDATFFYIWFTPEASCELKKRNISHKLTYVFVFIMLSVKVSDTRWIRRAGNKDKLQGNDKTEQHCLLCLCQVYRWHVNGSFSTLTSEQRPSDRVKHDNSYLLKLRNTRKHRIYFDMNFFFYRRVDKTHWAASFSEASVGRDATV